MPLQQGVVIEDLVVEYHRGGYPIRPLDGFAATIEPGKLALLLGPSGCGKTTLLSCLAGIQQPTSGRIRVDDTEVTSLGPSQLNDYRRNTVGVVFQAFNLVPSLTAMENVIVPLRASGMARGDAEARGAQLLADVGLADRGDHRPGALSGGQMQRVAIARALAMDPPLVLADEPTANLDHVQVEVVLRILRGLTNRGRTVIVSTHDHRLLPLADVVIDLFPGHSADLTPTTTVELADGDVLFDEGDEGSRLYRVESGAVALTRGTDLLHTSQPGEVFGEMAPLFSLPRSAKATAVGTTVLTGYTVDGFTAAFGGEELRRLVSRFE